MRISQPVSQAACLAKLEWEWDLISLSLPFSRGSVLRKTRTPKPPSEQTAGSLQIVLKVVRANIVFRSSPQRTHPWSSGKQQIAAGGGAISLARILLQSSLNCLFLPCTFLSIPALMIFLIDSVRSIDQASWCKPGSAWVQKELA